MNKLKNYEKQLNEIIGEENELHEIIELKNKAV